MVQNKSWPDSIALENKSWPEQTVAFKSETQPTYPVIHALHLSGNFMSKPNFMKITKNRKYHEILENTLN